LFHAALLALAGPARADYLAAVEPTSADLTVMDGSAEYVSFDYYDWGPGWSGVKRKKSVSESAGAAAFTFANEIEKTKTAFAIAGAWSAPEPQRIRFEATLTPAGDSELVMAQFGLNPGAAFEGGALAVTLADGSTSAHKLPLGRGDLGEAVARLELTDRAGAKTTLAFEKPAAVACDGQARLVLAKGSIRAGKPERLAFTLSLPQKTAFVPGPAAGAKLCDASGWYAFQAPSPIPASSEWRLTEWLEAPAGKHGRIARDGERLVYNGRPLKLWGINNSYGACAPDAALADKRADFYAALGINSVRLHKYADGAGWAGILSKESATAFDPKGLANMDYYVAALKKRGIYVKLSPVFIVNVGPADLARVPYAGEFEAKKGDWIDPKHGSLYIATELQDLLIEQVVALLKHANPHTGLRYADDPAVAYVELYNEDSALFGGVTSVMAKSPTLRGRAGQLFAQWLKRKYGGEPAFLAAWGREALNCSILANQRLPADESWAAGRIYPAGNPWFFDPANLETSQRPFKRRLLDTMAFLYELQTDVYARYAKAIRDAGYTGELIASNWQAGRLMSHFYNLRSDARLGTVDRHNYFGGGSRGLGAFNAASMLARPGSGTLSSSLQQVAGCPFMLSEWIHVAPNEWGVEGPALIGAYGMGLQGWDVSFPFQNRDDGTFSAAVGGETWDATAPNFLGVFPAVSRQVLRGDVREAPVAHTRNVHLPSLDAAQVGFSEDVLQAWDVKSFTSDVFPAEALAVAGGRVRFTESFEPTAAFDLEADRKDGRLVSATGQLQWQPGASAQDGFVAIDTPGTQAAVGFAEGQRLALADCAITLRSRYGAVYLSARSPQGTLKSDKAVLITALARARNKGSIVLNDAYLMSRGEVRNHRPAGPVVMEPVVAEVALARGGSPTLHVLDHSGAKTGRTLPVANGRFLIDTGRDATPYYLLEY
jgi:hypothetical protein